MKSSSSNAPMKYTITSDTITVIDDAGKPCVVKRGATNFAALRQALLVEDFAAARDAMTVRGAIAAWAKGAFTLSQDGESLLFDGKALQPKFGERVLAIAAAGGDPAPLLRFYERLHKNPSYRSIEQLWSFLQHTGIPIDVDGFFLAYKGVKSDYTDCHTGTISNRPGVKNEMPRNEISDDPKNACHVGFHVGSESYARGFGQRVVICRVDPADVVCVPYDCSQQKMRVCRYEVVGNFGGTMPSTVIEQSDLPKQPEAPAAQPAESAVASAEVASKMSASELMKLSLAELRRFAAHEMKIVGASKIPGGKLVLVEKIMEILTGEKPA